MPEDSGVGVSEFLVRVAHETALNGRCVVGDVRAEAALAANRAVRDLAEGSRRTLTAAPSPAFSGPSR